MLSIPLGLNKTKIVLVLLLLTLIGNSQFVQAAQVDEVLLQNGDRLSGRVITEEAEFIVMDHPAMGTIKIDKDFIRQMLVFAEVVEQRNEESILHTVKAATN